jgi:hypothetical protein
MNPTINNPTREYRAVIFATKELKPMSVKQFEYKSELRQEPRNGFAISSNDLEETTQLH